MRLDIVAHARELNVLRARYRARQHAPVLHTEHRVVRAVHDEARHGNREQLLQVALAERAVLGGTRDTAQ